MCYLQSSVLPLSIKCQNASTVKLLWLTLIWKMYVCFSECSRRRGFVQVIAKNGDGTNVNDFPSKCAIKNETYENSGYIKTHVRIISGNTIICSINIKVTQCGMLANMSVLHLHNRVSYVADPQLEPIPAKERERGGGQVTSPSHSHSHLGPKRARL